MRIEADNYECDRKSEVGEEAFHTTNTQAIDRHLIEEAHHMDGQSLQLQELEQLRSEKEFLLQQLQQLQQQECDKTKEKSTKKVVFEEPLETAKERKSPRELELDRKENYLRKLEEELRKREESISAKAAAYSGQREIDRKVDVTHLSKAFINTFPGIEPLPKNESSFETWKL